MVPPPRPSGTKETRAGKTWQPPLNTRRFYPELPLGVRFSWLRLRSAGKANNVQSKTRAVGRILMHWNRKRIATVTVLGGLACSVQAAQSDKPLARPAARQSARQNPFAAQHFEQAAISPDGRRVAWVEVRADEEGSPTGKEDIFVADASESSKPTRLTAGVPSSHYDEGGVAWSPDSKRIAFFSDAAKQGQLQLYVSSLGGGPAQKLTDVKGFLAGAKWSPDGKSVAVLFTENATREAGPLVAETPETGVIKDSFFEQRLAVVDPAAKTLRPVTPADTYIYDYDWTPDSKTILLTAAKGNGDNNWWLAELFSLDLSAEQMKPIYKPKLQIARPAVSP